MEDNLNRLVAQIEHFTIDQLQQSKAQFQANLQQQEEFLATETQSNNSSDFYINRYQASIKLYQARINLINNKLQEKQNNGQ